MPACEALQGLSGLLTTLQSAPLEDVRLASTVAAMELGLGIIREPYTVCS